MRQRIINFVDCMLNSKKWCVFLFILGNIFLYNQVKQALVEQNIQESIIYLILLFIIFYGVFSYIFTNYLSVKKLRLRGITTKATILNIKESLTGSPLSTQKMVSITCTYCVNNNNYTKIFRPSKEYYKKLSEYTKENQLEVVYDPIKPKRCLPAFVVKNYLVN